MDPSSYIYVYNKFLFLLLLIPYIVSVEENKFQTLVPLSLLPQDARRILQLGFPRGFFGTKYGVPLIVKEHKNVYPPLWYSDVSTRWDSFVNCLELYRDCYLHNLMVTLFINQTRFAKSKKLKAIELTPVELTVNFAYQYCNRRHYGATEWFKLYDYRGYCPNPCFNKTMFCLKVPNNLYGLCEIDKNNPFREDGFSCVCQQKYVWSPYSRQCVVRQINYKYDSTYCNIHGTEKVIFEEEVKCVCKEHYYGKTCHGIKDACKISVRGMLPGNTVCQISHGNGCISVGPDYPSGYPYYYCECKNRKFKRNYTILQDNCLLERKPCELMHCLNGAQCVSLKSGDELKPKCICQPGWTGPRCGIAQPNSYLSPWSPWSLCYPLCGEVRLRERKRFCLSIVTSCYQYTGADGFQTEIRACRTRACHRYFHPKTRDQYIKQVQVTDDKRLEVEYLTIGLILLVSFNILLIVIVVQLRLFNPFVRYVNISKRMKTKIIINR